MTGSPGDLFRDGVPFKPERADPRLLLHGMMVWPGLLQTPGQTPGQAPGQAPGG